jgi:hypothetical protein
MQIEDIKNKSLKSLTGEAYKGSMTIGNDLEIALQNSENDEELITNWQYQLEGLKDEIEHYWGELERLKINKCTLKAIMDFEYAKKKLNPQASLRYSE